MPKVGLAVLHGMGDQKTDFAEDFVRKVERRFARQIQAHSSHPASEIVIQRVFYADILSTTEKDLLRDIRQQHDLDWTKLRTFVVDNIGDAIAYELTPAQDDIYRQTHVRVAERLNDLEVQTGPDASISIAAHSLGSIVISNYLWDIQHPKTPPQDQYEWPHPDVQAAMMTPTSRMSNLANLFTFGSPIALWALRYPGLGEPVAFPMPGRAYPQLGVDWLNFFDDDDVIAYPLKPISTQYDSVVTRDIKVNAGSFFTNWTPLSHTQYWGDSEITNPIADKLAADWRHLNP